MPQTSVRQDQTGNPVEGIPIRPVLGQWNMDPGAEVPLGASPDMQNLQVVDGLLRKRPGFAELQTDAGISEAIMGLYSTQAADGTTMLVAVGPTSIWKFVPGTTSWTKLTGTALTASDQDMVSFETSQNKVVVANGVDPVKVFDIGGGSYASLSADCPAAHYLCRYNQRLIEAFTIEAANPLPYRLRYPVAGDHTNWTGLGSGFRDQGEFNYFIQNIRKIGLNMAIYYEKAIEVSISQPLATAPFRYEVHVADIGLLSPFTLQGRNQVHLFLGNDSFYSFDGTNPTDVSPQIRNFLFASLNPAKLGINFGGIFSDTQEYIAFTAMTPQTTPDTQWVFNYQRGIWYPWTVTGMRSCVTHRLDNSKTWDSISDTWDSYLLTWDSRIFSTATPLFITGHTNGKAYKWSPQYLSDNGTSIPCKWTSQDFTSEKVFRKPGKKLALKRIFVEYQATGVPFTLNFYTSIDGGGSWVSQGSVSGSPSSSGYLNLTCDIMHLGNRVRFKFENNTTNQAFQISQFVLKFELHETEATA